MSRCFWIGFAIVLLLAIVYKYRSSFENTTPIITSMEELDSSLSKKMGRNEGCSVYWYSNMLFPGDKRTSLYVEFRDAKINLDLLNFLQQIPTCTSVTLSFTNCKFSQDFVIPNCVQLESLAFDGSQLEPDSLLCFQNCTCIRRVYFYMDNNTRLSVSNADVLSKFQHLEFLIFSNVDLTKETASILNSGHLKRLRFLQLSNVPDNFIQFIHSFPLLRTLHIYNSGSPESITDEVISQISDIPLNDLEIYNSCISVNSILVFKKWNSLESLVMRDCPFEVGTMKGVNMGDVLSN